MKTVGLKAPSKTIVKDIKPPTPKVEANDENKK